MYTLDSNVLVYAADSASPLHAQALAIRDRAVLDRGNTGLCFPVLLEFFAVLTDPARVRTPLPPEEAWREVETYRQGFRIFYPDGETWDHLARIISRYRTKRQDVFDAVIVALMVQHGVRGIYTANELDFVGFKEIEVLPWG